MDTSRTVPADAGRLSIVEAGDAAKDNRTKTNLRQMPAAPAALLREELVIRVVRTALNLAEAQMCALYGPGGAPRGVELCKECRCESAGRGAEAHRLDCRTGAVLGAVEELVASYDFDGRGEALARQERGGAVLVSEGAFGEPWSVRLDRTTDAVFICNVDGIQVCELLAPRVGLPLADLAFRVVDCVNSCSGPKGGGA